MPYSNSYENVAETTKNMVRAQIHINEKTELMRRILGLREMLQYESCSSDDILPIIDVLIDVCVDSIEASQTYQNIIIEMNFNTGRYRSEN